MLIKWSMSDIIRGSIPDKGNVKDYMDAIEEKIIKSDKVKTTNLLSSFTNIIYENVGAISY